MDFWSLTARIRAAYWRRILRTSRVFQDRYGTKYVLYPTDDLALYFKNHGWFEVSEQQFVKRFLRPGMIACDVGAYIGVYSCLMGILVGKDGHVHAFEANRDSVSRLRENIHVNGLDNVVVSHGAVTDRNGTALLWRHGPPFESRSSVRHPNLAYGGQVIRPQQEERVPAIRLDTYCENAGVKRLDFLKVDVEGAEFDVLSGADLLLKDRAIRCVMYEVGESDERIRRLLESSGYRVFNPGRKGELLPVSAHHVEPIRNRIACLER